MSTLSLSSSASSCFASAEKTSTFWKLVALETGLQEVDSEDLKNACISAIHDEYMKRSAGSVEIVEFREQGGCSYTLLVTFRQVQDVQQDTKEIIQIRPRQHSLSLSTCHAALTTYGAIVPRVETLPVTLPADLTVFTMSLLPGVPASSILHPSTSPSPSPPLSPTQAAKRITLIASLATVLARAYPPTTTTAPHPPRADSPISDHHPPPPWLHPCTGKVGAQLIPKLTLLTKHLPTPALRAKAHRTLSALLAVRPDYPLALTHGDLLPSNILADPATARVTGLVDWAEAEVLPFGTCFYGVEYLLGELVEDPAGAGSSEASLPEEGRTRKKKPVFRYADDADFLRDVFWDGLAREVPALRGEDGGRREEEVRVMRDVGVLLWSGFAWDGGRIDRVVDEERDVGEVVCLEAFLGG